MSNLKCPTILAAIGITKTPMANRPVIKACISTHQNSAWRLKIIRCPMIGRISRITASFLIISMIMSTISACATISLSTRRWTMRAVMMTVSGTSPYRPVRRANMARWWSQTVIIGTPKRRANMATTLMASKCTAIIMTRRLSRMICAAKMCWLWASAIRPWISPLRSRNARLPKNASSRRAAASGCCRNI